MIDRGIKGEWKSPEHRTVAINLAICNPKVNSMNKLIEVCTAINNIPHNRIKLVTLEDCITEYQIPYLY